ncbi:MAG TPA: 4Fe-4S binding protein [Aromatoleum sp.]|uniref:4Fe-4S binding protein n=1 Tax=Aromatoleum sp. TaxID=2307007 RepID=UPI002B46BEE6|nr:4Fe-4S binding protein [Aromatoleum sp.]HJV25637.1 4Fe-4S binding protein [Aromatoleum sp.]
MARQARGSWRWWPLALLLWVLAASAGELTQADVVRRFPPPLQVGAKLGTNLNGTPAWPLTNELTPEAGPVGYVFESIDLAPIPGFEGTPFNLLIAVDNRGDFMAVEVLRQHEPVFLSGLGEAPLHAFVAQYVGKNIKQAITVSSAYGRSSDAGGNRVVLDGVAKATASIRVVNQTVLTSALAVARAHLGLAAPGRQSAVAEVRTDLREDKDFAALLRDGDLIRKRWSNREVEALFAGTEAAGLDESALAAPDDTFFELYVGYLNAPTLGRALLGERGYAELMRQLAPGQSAYWLAALGRQRLLGADFVRGTVPPRLTVSQDGAPVEARDADLELHPPAGAPSFDAMVVLKSPQLSGMDPGRAVNIALEVVREKGQIYPVLTRKSLDLDYTPPARYFTWPPEPLPEWLMAWKARWPELAIIVAALLTLSVVLARPRWVAMDERRMLAFRLGFLAFTLVFVGWYAQGQLSIVQLTGAVKTLVAGQGLGTFLYDPVSLLLIAFTAISFVLWGRGTFCGWLCPFGALQEFVAVIARRLGVKRRRLPPRLERLLERGRYVVLAGLLLAAAVAPGVAERMVEIEPFKTAITVGFDRSWPFVAWAVLLLALGGVYYKFFCRFVCPLGAAITLGGRLRRLDWQAIRPECGRPCQTCRARCEYDAIGRDGRIIYDRCFQCLDCVGVYHDARRCAPLVFHARTGREWRLHQAPAEQPADA